MRADILTRPIAHVRMGVNQMEPTVKTRVLVVEDNPMSLEMLTDWLEIGGYEVKAAEDLAGAQATFQSARPALVLLDIRLGEEDGADFARWIRARPEADSGSVPVIAVTAHALRDEQDRILQSGCNAVVCKPVDLRQLKGEMERWLAVGRA
jgi:two-component system, cell cycle response regulator DivK